jgi:hypothetical protein
MSPDTALATGMAKSSRERVTIDLRGIGDAVRAAAAGRGQTLAAYARAALVAAADSQPPAIQRLEPPAPRRLRDHPPCQQDGLATI